MRSEMQIQDGLQAFWSQRDPGVRVSGVRRLSIGWETDVCAFAADGGPFKGPQELVLRLYPGMDALDRFHAEVHVLRGLAAQGFPVPTLVAAEGSGQLFGGPFLIMEQIRGVSMWQRYGSIREMTAPLSSLLVRLHRLDARQFIGGPWPTAAAAGGSFSLAFMEEKLFGTPALADAFGTLHELLQKREAGVGREPRCLIHGDFHPDNVLVRENGEPCVIDWSAAALDDPRMDVAQAAVLAFTDVSPEAAQAVRAGYEACLGEPLRDYDYFELLALTRRVGSVVVIVALGSSALGLRPGLEAKLRQELPKIRRLVDYLLQRAGVESPGMYRLLAQAETAATLGGDEHGV